jgi:hypothetical protein
MRKFSILPMVIALLAILVMAAPVTAKGPVGETIAVSWWEDAVRCNPDSSVKSSWTNDGPYSADLVRTGKACHFADIQQFYNWPLEDLSGSVVISGAGKLSGHAKYISPYSFLPIRERFRGEVTIDADAGTMVGTHTQRSYAFGSREDVLSYYPGAVPAEKEGAGWWFIGYTDYTAHQ